MSNPKEKFYRLTEYNDWEGETWYHYFLAKPGVREALKSIIVLLGQGWTYRVNGWTCPQCSYAAEVEIRKGSGLKPAKKVPDPSSELEFRND